MGEIRVLHAADLHVDSPLRGLPAYEGAPTEDVRAATRVALENLVEAAVEHAVHLVVIVGDLYDGRWNDYATGLFVTAQFARLGEAEIPVALVYGNHDAESKITAKLRLPPNTRAFSSKRAETQVYEDLGIALHGQSYQNPACTNDLAAGYPEAVPHMVNIGLLHTALDGRPGHAPYAPCSLDELRAKGYEYWALGHVHKREVLATDPHVVFPGNLQGRDVGETGAKGATLITFADGDVTLEPLVLDAVRWERAEVDVSAAGSLDDCLDACSDSLALLAGGLDRTCALRIRLAGETTADTTLRANPDHVLQELRALALDCHGANFLVEKLELATQAPRGTCLLAGEGPAGEIGRVLAEAQENLADLHDAGNADLAALGALRAKLAAQDSELGTLVLGDEELAEALKDASALLATRLGFSGGSDAA
jgi:DNA repair exonuclease SbcCD nuclease subunit